MRIGLHANPHKPVALEIARRALGVIGDRAEVVVSDENPSLAPECPHSSLARMEAAAVLAIGGDGTFLHALRATRVPLLPLNAGTLGVLAEVDAREGAELDGAIEKLLAGTYFLEERLKLAAELGGEPLADATNEYLVHAARVGKTSRFEISFDGELAGRIRADGLLVGTPTGSTAYALSVLGPVVEPTVDAIVLTALAPFRAGPRAMVLDPLRSVTVAIVPGASDAVVLPDGDGEVPLPSGGRVTFFRSPRRATLVRFGVSFLDRLRGKRILPWSEATTEVRDGTVPTAP